MMKEFAERLSERILEIGGNIGFTVRLSGVRSSFRGQNGNRVY